MINLSNRVSSNAITGVAPITILEDSPDRAFIDPSKPRTISNVILSQFNTGDFLDYSPNNVIGSEIFNSSDLPLAPNLEEIFIQPTSGTDTFLSGTYIDATGKTKARIVFKITNPDTTKIVDVDIRQSLTSSESGL